MFRTIQLHSAGSHAHLAWAEGLTFSVPGLWFKQTGLHEFLDASDKLRLPTNLPFLTQDGLPDSRLLAAFTNQPPISSRLPFSYRLIPSQLRSFLASVLGKWQRQRSHIWASFPQWPIDLSADFLTDLLTGCGSPWKHQPTPVILTHDIDSAEGLDNLLHWFLSEEESVGARSLNFVVPFGWPLDHSKLDQIVEQGHTIGIHGFDHSNRTPFCAQEEIRQRLKASQPLIDKYEIRGYRAPSLLRTKPLIQNLSQQFLFDSSIPTSGGLFPVPNNGCATARPFNLCGILEIPLSLPRDGSLKFLGYSPREILSLWKHCSRIISQSGGVIILLTHCEKHFSGNPSMLEIYREFLQEISQCPDYVFASEDQVCSLQML